MLEPQIPDRHSVAVHFLHLLTDYAGRRGLPLGALLERASIDAASLADPNDRVPYASFRRLCEMAASTLDEPSLGLKLGGSVRPGHLGSHGFALMSCSTVAELMQQSARYSALTIDAGHNVFERRGDEFVRIWYSNIPGQASLGRLQDELQQAIVVTLARWFTNRDDLNPNWVSFQHDRPDDLREYEALFRCPVHFGAAETAISVHRSVVDMPLPHANAQIRRIMDDLCAQLLQKLGDTLEPPWLALARKAVLNSFRQGIPEIGAVVAATGLTENELKENFVRRGMSFRSFVDDLRQSLAVGYMRDPCLSLVDIAYLLGFSEQSAFQRAFKRWTGMTPGDYRRTVPAPPGRRAPTH